MSRYRRLSLAKGIVHHVVECPDAFDCPLEYALCGAPRRSEASPWVDPKGIRPCARCEKLLHNKRSRQEQDK